MQESAAAGPVPPLPCRPACCSRASLPLSVCVTCRPCLLPRPHSVRIGSVRPRVACLYEASRQLAGLPPGRCPVAVPLPPPYPPHTLRCPVSWPACTAPHTQHMIRPLSFFCAQLPPSPLTAGRTHSFLPCMLLQGGAAPLPRTRCSPILGPLLLLCQAGTRHLCCCTAPRPRLNDVVGPAPPMRCAVNTVFFQLSRFASLWLEKPTPFLRNPRIHVPPSCNTHPHSVACDGQGQGRAWDCSMVTGRPGQTALQQPARKAHASGM